MILNYVPDDFRFYGIEKSHLYFLVKEHPLHYRKLIDWIEMSHFRKMKTFSQDVTFNWTFFALGYFVCVLTCSDASGFQLLRGKWAQGQFLPHTHERHHWISNMFIVTNDHQSCGWHLGTANFFNNADVVLSLSVQFFCAVSLVVLANFLIVTHFFLPESISKVESDEKIRQLAGLKLFLFLFADLQKSGKRFFFTSIEIKVEHYHQAKLPRVWALRTRIWIVANYGLFDSVLWGFFRIWEIASNGSRRHPSRFFTVQEKSHWIGIR